MRTAAPHVDAMGNLHLNQAGAEATHIDLFDVISEVWARKFIILLPAAICALLAFVVFSLKSPDFYSEAQIIVENRENAFTQPVQGEQRLSEQQILLDEEAVRSQVEVLKSRDLALAVATELSLFENPEFNSSGGSLSMLMTVLDLAGLAPGRASMTDEERVLNAFAKKLTVYPVARTRVIAVQFESSDPQFAAKVVNTLVDEYLVRLREAKQSTTRDATRWLSEQIDDLRQEVEVAEAEVARFRSDKDILLGLNDASLQAQQLTELNSQLIASRAQKSEAQARAQMIKATLRSGQDLTGSSDILDSQLISRLQEQLITLEANEAELSSTFLPGHPRLRETRAEISRLREQVRSEMQKIVRALESEAQVAAARETALSASLEALKEQVATTSTDEVQLRALEREAKAKRDLLETLLGRFREASARENPDSATADARVISRASVSNVPVTPNPLLVSAVAFILVGMIAAGLVFSLSLARAGQAAAQQRTGFYPGEPDPSLEEDRRGIPAPETIDPPSETMAQLNRVLSDPLKPITNSASEQLDGPDEENADGIHDDTGVDPVLASGSASSHDLIAPSAQKSQREDNPVADVELETHGEPVSADEGAQSETLLETDSPAPDEPFGADAAEIDTLTDVKAYEELEKGQLVPEFPEEAINDPIPTAAAPIIADSAPLTPLGSPLTAKNLPTVIVDAKNGQELENQTLRLLRGGASRIFVTSPREPEISGLIAQALSKSIASGTSRTILVNSCFDENNDTDSPGLADVMLDKAPLKSAIVRDHVSGIDVLNPGALDISPILLSGSERFLTLFERLEKDYDVTIVAAPPINTHPEGRLMAPFMDAAILVVMADTDERAAERAENRLMDSDLSTIIRYNPGNTQAKMTDDMIDVITPFETAAQ